MNARKGFCFLTSIAVLTTILMVQGVHVPTAEVLRANPISFTKHTIDDYFWNARSLYAADIDSDGDMDVLGAADLADDITWWENDGAESFTEHTIADQFNGANSVFATDVDGDSDIDVLGSAWNVDSVAWWENDGNQNFTEHIIDADFDGAEAIFATDVDNDGDIDILGAAIFANDIAWWENDGNENFTEHLIADDFGGAHSVYATDLDSDGDMDVLGAAWSADSITWWENDGAENFAEITIDTYANLACSAYAADLDSDGDVDVLGAAWGADEIPWYENDGSESFAKHTIAVDFDGARSVYAIDLDGDGDMDAIGAASAADDITWWENDGSENFTEHTIDADFDGAFAVYATDVNDDGRADILAAAYAGDEIAWWEQGDASANTPPSISGLPDHNLPVDTNRDNATDLWAYASDAQSSDAALTFAISNTPDPIAGVSIDSNRYVDINPTPGWTGQTDVTIRVTDPEGLSDSDSFRVTISATVEEFVYLPFAMRLWPPIPDAPVLDPISNPDGDGNYTVSWNAVDLAETYTLQEDDNAAFSSAETRYDGSATSWTASAKEIGTYYYRVRASNTYGSSSWSGIESVQVTVPPPAPPPCEVTCSASAGGFGFGITCESGPTDSSSECWQVFDPSRGIVTRCEGTRTYTESKNTYSFAGESWSVSTGGGIEYRVSVNVTGGVFGDITQHCQNY